MIKGRRGWLVSVIIFCIIVLTVSETPAPPVPALENIKFYQLTSAQINALSPTGRWAFGQGTFADPSVSTAVLFQRVMGRIQFEGGGAPIDDGFKNFVDFFKGTSSIYYRDLLGFLDQTTASGKVILVFNPSVSPVSGSELINSNGDILRPEMPNFRDDPGTLETGRYRVVFGGDDLTAETQLLGLSQPFDGPRVAAHEFAHLRGVYASVMPGGEDLAGLWGDGRVPFDYYGKIIPHTVPRHFSEINASLWAFNGNVKDAILATEGFGLVRGTYAPLEAFLQQILTSQLVPSNVRSSLIAQMLALTPEQRFFFSRDLAMLFFKKVPAYTDVALVQDALKWATTRNPVNAETWLGNTALNNIASSGKYGTLAEIRTKLQAGITITGLATDIKSILANSYGWPQEALNVFQNVGFTGLDWFSIIDSPQFPMIGAMARMEGDTVPSSSLASSAEDARRAGRPFRFGEVKADIDGIAAAFQVHFTPEPQAVPLMITVESRRGKTIKDFGYNPDLTIRQPTTFNNALNTYVGTPLGSTTLMGIPNRPGSPTTFVNLFLTGEELTEIQAGKSPNTHFVVYAAGNNPEVRYPITVQLEVPVVDLNEVLGSPYIFEVEIDAVRAGLQNGVMGIRLSYSATDSLASLRAAGDLLGISPASLTALNKRIWDAIRVPPANAGLTYSSAADIFVDDAARTQKIIAPVQGDLAQYTVASFGESGAIAGTVIRADPAVPGGYQIVHVPYVMPSVMESIAPSGSVVVIGAPSGSAAGAAMRTAATQLGLPTSANWQGTYTAGGGAASAFYTEARLNEGLGMGLRSRWGIEVFSGQTPTMGGSGVLVKMGNLQVAAAKVAPTGQGLMDGAALFAVRTGDLDGTGVSRAAAVDFARAAPTLRSGVALGAAAVGAAVPGIVGAGMHRIQEGTWKGAVGAGFDTQMNALKDPVYDVTTIVNTTAALTTTRTFASVASRHAMVKAGGLLAVEAVPIVNVAAAIMTAPDAASLYEQVNVKTFGAPNPATATPRERLLSDTALDKILDASLASGSFATAYIRAGQAWNIYIREGDDFNVKKAYLDQLALSRTAPEDRFEALYFDRLGLGRRHSHVNRLGGDINTIYERNFQAPLADRLKTVVPKNLSSMESVLRVNAEKIKNEVRLRETFAAGRNLRGQPDWAKYISDQNAAADQVKKFRKNVDDAAKNNGYEIPELDDSVSESARDRGSVIPGGLLDTPAPTPDGKLLEANGAYKDNYIFVARGADVRPDPLYASFSQDMRVMLGPDRVFYPNGFFPPNSRQPSSNRNSWASEYGASLDWTKYNQDAANRSIDMYGQYRDIMTAPGGVYDTRGGGSSGGNPNSDPNSWYGSTWEFFLPDYWGAP